MIRALSRLRALGPQLTRFGTVGAMGFVIDIGLFNLLMFTVLEGHQLMAKTASVAAAALFNYVGNRVWTFRAQRSRRVLPELTLFALTNVLGLLPALLCLVVSRDLLGLHSTLADNISANVVGLGLGMVLRFALYHSVVFRRSTLAQSTQPVRGPADLPSASSAR